MKMTRAQLRQIIREELNRVSVNEILKGTYGSPRGHFVLEIPIVMGMFPEPKDVDAVKKLADEHGTRAELDPKIKAYKILGTLQDLLAVEKEINKHPNLA